MSLSSMFKTDPELERKGVWLEFPGEEGVPAPEFLLSRVSRNNPDYAKVADRIWKPHRRAQELGMVGAQLTEKLNRQVFAEAAILGWKNVPLSDVTGNEADEGFAEYSPENAEKLLKNLPELYAALLDVAIKRETFQRTNKEDDAKNSSPSLRTSSSKAAQKRGSRSRST